jgi:hypothetical protein
MTEKKESGIQWESASSYNADHDATRRTVIEQETALLKVEEKVKDVYQAAKDYLT